MAKRRPGVIRDAIVSYLSEVERDASVGEITQAVEAELGRPSRRHRSDRICGSGMTC